MPVVVCEDDSFSVGGIEAFLLYDFAGGFEDFLFDLLPLGVLRFEVFRDFFCACGFVGSEQFDGESRVSHSSSGVEHRSEAKADMEAVDGFAREASGFDKGGDAGEAAFGESFQAETGEYSVFAAKAYDIRDSSHSGERGGVDKEVSQRGVELCFAVDFIGESPGEFECDQ